MENSLRSGHDPFRKLSQFSRLTERFLDGTAEHTKAQVDAPAVRRAPAAARRTAVEGGDEAPATAPAHPARAPDAVPVGSVTEPLGAGTPYQSWHHSHTLPCMS